MSTCEECAEVKKVLAERIDTLRAEVRELRTETEWVDSLRATIARVEEVRDEWNRRGGSQWLTDQLTAALEADKEKAPQLKADS